MYISKITVACGLLLAAAGIMFALSPPIRRIPDSFGKESGLKNSPAQDLPEPVNSKDVLIEILGLHAEEKWEEALTLYDKISRNDTNYAMSLVEKSYTLFQLERYGESMAVCREGIALKKGYLDKFYMNWGSCLDNLDRPEEAIEVYEQSAALFPGAHLIRFNMGVTYEKLKRYNDAAEAYKQAIRINPYHPTSHIRLGSMAANEKKTAQAMLSFNMFLILEPNTDRARNVLALFNEMVSSKFQAEPTGVTLSAEGDDFSEADLVINNHVALNKNYKIPIKSDLYLIRQNHALFEKLKYDPNDKGFWMQTYVKFFKDLFDQGWFDGFSYHCLQSSSNELHRKLVAKNRTRINKFVEWAKSHFDNVMNIKEIEADGKKMTLRHWYLTTERLYAVGNQDPARNFFTGYFESYNSNSTPAAKGTFDAKGRRQGVWLKYNDNGILTEEAPYNDAGTLHGLYKSYYDNGNIKLEIEYTDGKKMGRRKEYYEQGGLYEKSVYENDQANGLSEIFYETGGVRYRMYFRNNVLADSLVQYYDDGQIMSAAYYVDGKKNGAYRTWHRNGAPEKVSAHKDDELEGEWRKYYMNRQLEQEGPIKNSTAVGAWKKYYPDGTLEEEIMYDEKGNLNGKFKGYDRAGRLHYEMEYARGIISSYKYYNGKGETVSEGKLSRNRLDYKGRYPDDVLMAEGVYVDGEEDGEWLRYTQNGALSTRRFYKNGKPEGKQTDYYPSGKVKAEFYYKEGVLDGYYTSYHVNGRVKTEGWYTDGDAQGQWRYYRTDGSLETISYYLNDERRGWQEYYTVTGRKDYEYLYDKGDQTAAVYYDSTGAVKDSITLPFAGGTYLRHHYNGKTEFTGHYVNGQAHGTFTWYHFDGKKSTEGRYFNGKKHGIWTSYHDNGKIRKQGEYFYGELHGTWKHFYKNGTHEEVRHYEYGENTGEWQWYYDNGKLSSTKKYISDLTHGEARYYDVSGELAHIRYYEYGKMVAHSYAGRDGNPVAPIPVENETGTLTAYYRNGNKSREFGMNKGDFHGNYFKYCTDGSLYERYEYVNDELQGPSEMFRPGGKPKEKENYADGNLEGACTYYRDNGNVESELNYRCGELHGECRYYDKTGKLVRTVFYYDDDPVWEKR